MDLKQLEAFEAVMAAGSLTAAGRLLGCSQPSVTRFLKELETEIGYPLFVRNGPRVRPTRQGFQLHREVQRSFIGLKQLSERAKAIGLDGGEHLTLAATPALSAGLLPAALGTLQHLPFVTLRSLAAEDVVQTVLAAQVDVGVCSLPLEHVGMTLHWIGETVCQLALPDTHRLASLDVVPIAALADERLLVLSDMHRLRRSIDFALAQAGITPKAQLETNQSTNALMSVRAGLGVAILEPSTALGLPVQGVTVRALDVRIPFYFGVVTPVGSEATPERDAFFQALEQTASSLFPSFRRREASEHASVLQAIHGMESIQDGVQEDLR